MSNTARTTHKSALAVIGVVKRASARHTWLRNCAMFVIAVGVSYWASFVIEIWAHTAVGNLPVGNLRIPPIAWLNTQWAAFATFFVLGSGLSALCMRMAFRTRMERTHNHIRVLEREMALARWREEMYQRKVANVFEAVIDLRETTETELGHLREELDKLLCENFVKKSAALHRPLVRPFNGAEIQHRALRITRCLADAG